MHTARKEGEREREREREREIHARYRCTSGKGAWWERARGRMNSPHEGREGPSRRKKKVRWLNKGGSGEELRAQPRATLPPVAQEPAAWSARFSNSDTFERVSHVRFEPDCLLRRAKTPCHFDCFARIFVHSTPLNRERHIAIEALRKHTRFPHVPTIIIQ